MFKHLQTNQTMNIAAEWGNYRLLKKDKTVWKKIEEIFKCRLQTYP